METIELISVYRDPAAYGILYDLLSERTPEQSISHKEMPSYKEHVDFVASVPYRFWYLIKSESDGYVGSVYMTNNNEIGVSIFNANKRKGYGEAALREIMRLHEPLPAIPSIRRGFFIAHVSPLNDASQELFKKLGFKHIQNTYALE
jgi:RimJ/RimL family protein N-acetyltransferase